MTTITAKFIALLKPKWTWLQFRLRTLFVLVVVAAIPCAWLKWTMERKRQQRVAVGEIERIGGTVFYDWQWADKNEPPGPAWLRKLLGDDLFSNVVGVEFHFWYDDKSVTDDPLVNLEPLIGLEYLHVRGEHIRDADCAHLVGLSQLRILDYPVLA